MMKNVLLGHRISLSCTKFYFGDRLRRGCWSISSSCVIGSRRFLSDDQQQQQQQQPSISASLFKNPIVHQLWTARQKAKQELKNIGNDVKKSIDNKSSLPTGNIKTPNDSRVEVSYPFQTDALLWEAYRNPWGQMRIGKVLEDLDALAGNIAFFHVHTENRINENEYPVIVTASVDRIRLNHRPEAGTNQFLSGQVTWTGTSSMEIRMHCTEEGSDQEWLEAYVTFVTLHPTTKKPMQIPSIHPVTDEEKVEFDAGSVRAAAKKRRRKQKIQSTLDSEYESKAITLLEEAGPLLTMPSLADPHSILIENTTIQNAMIAQPQVQNLHNRVFGGFLMRRAFELAYSNAYLFGGVRPIFLEVDEVSFTSPVDVGDLLVFHSRILYTEHQAGHLDDYYRRNHHHSDVNASTSPPVSLIHVEVEAWVTEPERVAAKMSNQFYFTFAVVQDDGHAPPIRRVLPSNIDEARRVALRMNMDEEQKAN